MQQPTKQNQIQNYLFWLSDRGLVTSVARSAPGSTTGEPPKASSQNSASQKINDIDPTSTKINANLKTQPKFSKTSKEIISGAVKMSHETLSVKFYGSFSLSYLFIFEIEDEKEFHPSSRLIVKIATALGLKQSEFGFTVIRGHLRKHEVREDENKFILNELARLINKIKTSSSRSALKVTLMGAHTLSLFAPLRKFHEQNNALTKNSDLEYLTTWHPMDMNHNTLLKKDCWQALQVFN